jgi:hypothetical protein
MEGTICEFQGGSKQHKEKKEGKIISRKEGRGEKDGKKLKKKQ